jgi:hypothetical protein
MYWGSVGFGVHTSHFLFLVFLLTAKFLFFFGAAFVVTSSGSVLFGVVIAAVIVFTQFQLSSSVYISAIIDRSMERKTEKATRYRNDAKGFNQRAAIPFERWQGTEKSDSYHKKDIKRDRR